MPGINTTTPHQIDIDSKVRESVVHKGAQVKKPTPFIRTDRNNRAAIIRVADSRGGRTQTYRLTGVTQDAVSEEAAMLVKDRRGLKVEAQVGQCRKKKVIGGMG